MEKHPKKEKYHGKEVWVNPKTESMRKEECFCLNCKHLDNCFMAQSLHEICVKSNIALIVTRCLLWKSKTTRCVKCGKELEDCSLAAQMEHYAKTGHKLYEEV